MEGWVDPPAPELGLWFAFLPAVIIGAGFIVGCVVQMRANRRIPSDETKPVKLLVTITGVSWVLGVGLAWWLFWGNQTLTEQHNETRFLEWFDDRYPQVSLTEEQQIGLLRTGTAYDVDRNILYSLLQAENIKGVVLYQLDESEPYEYVVVKQG